MTNWTKADSVHSILEGILIVAMLTSGILFILWTSPSDQADIDNTVLATMASYANPGNVTCCNHLDGPATVSIKPGSEARYLVQFRTDILPGSPPMLYSAPGGSMYAVGPFLWTPPNSTGFSIERRYVAFIYSFGGVCSTNGCAPRIWFTGPQGNLSASIHTTMYAGNDVFHSGFAGTSVLEASSAGNYTLHALNFFSGSTSTSINGSVVMGASSVIFSKPYAYVGAAGISIAVALSVASGFVGWRRLKHRAQPVDA